MRAPPAGRRPPVRSAAAARPAENSLALARPPDITCGQRGKGGGPTACIAVGLARWLSASRRPAVAPAVVSAPVVRSLAVAAPSSGRGPRAARRRPANTRQTPSPRADRPCPAGPRVASLASRGARRCARPSGGHAPPRVRGARPHGRRPGVFIFRRFPISAASPRFPPLPVRWPRRFPFGRPRRFAFGSPQLVPARRAPSRPQAAAVRLSCADR